VIKALIFDFDGLILDTEVPEFTVWRDLYADHGQELALTTWAACIGTADAAFDPYVDLEARLGRPLDRAALRDVKRARVTALIEAQPPLPGVVDYLTRPASWGWGWRSPPARDGPGSPATWGDWGCSTASPSSAPPTT
jgi:beta-phosphoglucomutase-like phosphatase (HAD superfamily)